MADSPLDLTIIIASYNTRELLRSCIESVYQYTEGISFEVICVDDNSPDGSADMVAAMFPQVILVRNTERSAVRQEPQRGYATVPGALRLSPRQRHAADE